MADTAGCRFVVEAFAFLAFVRATDGETMVPGFLACAYASARPVRDYDTKGEISR